MKRGSATLVPRIHVGASVQQGSASARCSVQGRGSVAGADADLCAGAQQQGDHGCVGNGSRVMEDGVPARVPCRHVGSRRHALRIVRQDGVTRWGPRYKPPSLLRGRCHGKTMPVPVSAIAWTGRLAPVVECGSVRTGLERDRGPAVDRPADVAYGPARSEVTPTQMEGSVAA